MIIKGQKTSYPGLWKDMALIYAAVFVPIALVAYVLESIAH
jgi:hypothetical protein